MNEPKATASTHRTFDSDPAFLNDTSILITGGTGSFGRRFIKTILDRASPRRLVILSRDELKQYEIDQELSGHPKYDRVRFFIGDVRDQDRLDMAFRDIDTVIHAAALKHVPTAEYNPFECIHTNVLGAENVVRASLRNGVKRVIALSTDKAANPINLYGASKLASDKIFVAANNLSGAVKTRYSVVRYGNVLGSRGSVIPLFKRHIEEGAKELPITDVRMTRFWITLSQGVDFVLSSMKKMVGGEIFVPKIPSMKVVDLARAMAPDLEHRVVGIRPGEKLHEVMVPQEDARQVVETDDRYVIQPSFAFWQGAEYLKESGRPVDDRFEYASDTNTEWLDEENLKTLLKEV
ncbi:MAG: UDP-N-acetylglucosamine 4,6-dehydratase (inverting) [Alphaproteobacteria bacterium]|nr:UDP-N-acetylglucosamine 4,6-dehydratase (inverting) [Alphaproteobacteria bacterium]